LLVGRVKTNRSHRASSRIAVIFITQDCYGALHVVLSFFGHAKWGGFFPAA
jgi:hypothetical protein